MKRGHLIAILILAALSVRCTGKDEIIIENVCHAERQLSHLIAAAEEGDTIRVPSTYRNGKVVFVRTNDWVSGFFAGTLWYMYELTGNEMYAEKAQKHTEVLHRVQYLKSHHDVGFMIGSSYGNGLRLKEVPGYDTVIVNAAKSLATRYRPDAGVIQSWNVTGRGWQSLRGWKCPVIIDNMMNLELMFRASEITGDDTYRNIALSHTEKTMENHFREDFSTYHVVDYDDQTGEVRSRCTAQGIDDDSRWARGQAWALYGFTATYRFTDDPRHLQRAIDIADYLLKGEDNMPEDLVPLWDFDAVEYSRSFQDMQQFNQTRDVSSAAIIASALYELYTMTENKFYKKKADKIICSLSEEPYRAAEGTNGGFILMHSVGSIPHGGNIDVPLNYADYYFLEALVRKRRIEERL